jgi:hypothetical protein
MTTIVARCVQCDAEFCEEQLVGAKGCPACGTESLPCDPKNDITVKINTHELRVLTMWATWWAQEKCSLAAQKTVACIVQRLSKQTSKPLTLAAEVRDLQASGVDASLVRRDGTVEVPSKGKPS